MTEQRDGAGASDAAAPWPELVDLVGEMLALVHGSDVVELDVSLGPSHLALRRPAPGVALPATEPAGAPAAAAPFEPFLAVTSPLVGIFRPSVNTGDHVAVGQPLGAIEALGMPTSVDAPAAGVVAELLAGDGSPVEFGQSLLMLRLDHRA